ncbi:hypothetical protein ACLOJK_034204, partial [Asimina triloba]
SRSDARSDAWPVAAGIVEDEAAAESDRRRRLPATLAVDVATRCHPPTAIVEEARRCRPWHRKERSLSHVADEFGDGLARRCCYFACYRSHRGRRTLTPLFGKKPQSTMMEHYIGAPAVHGR